LAVLFRTKGRLARVTLARPPLNILDIEHLGLLADVLEQARDAAIIVLESTAPRAFCAGNDVSDHTPERAPQMLAAFHRAIRALLGADAVTIADVRGDALGGGCELVAACDLAYATPKARFGQPEIDVGCFPPVAASLLPRRIGWTRAAELVLTGRRIDAGLACAWGLITDVAADGAETTTKELESKSPAVLRAAKKALRHAARGAPAEGIETAEQIYIDDVLPLDDCREGVDAFLTKRKPFWEGK
jgi:cyclohexa-1,5-dienecarbonyl-CoA hydratase